MNEGRSLQSNATEGQATRWQVWLRRGPWIVLIVGMAGVGAQLGATLDLIANIRGQGIGWSLTQGFNSLGLALMNAAIVFFLFLALRLLVTGAPRLWQLQTTEAAPVPEPGPEGMMQEAQPEAVLQSPEPSATAEADKAAVME